MKNVILAIALAAFASTAWACPTCGPARSGSLSASSTVNVGGQVGSYVAGPGSNYASMRSVAGAGNVTGGWSTGYGRPNSAAGSTGAYGAGYSYVNVKGTVTDGAYGYNYGEALQNTTADFSLDASECFGGPNDKLSTSSLAEQGTYALGEVYGTGKTKMFSAAAAGNTSWATGRQSPRGNLAVVSGGTIGGTGVVVFGRTKGDATGLVDAVAYQEGSASSSVWDAPRKPWDDVTASGSAHTASSTVGGVRDNGFGAAGTIGGAGYKARAKLVEGDGFLLTSAKASDWKFSASGAIGGGNGTWKVKKNGDWKRKVDGGHLTTITAGTATVGAEAHAEGQQALGDNTPK